MKILKIFVFILTTLSTRICAQEIQLKPISINGFSRDKIIEVLKLVSKNSLRIKESSINFNYTIDESLKVDNLYSIDTSYVDKFMLNIRNAWVEDKSIKFLGKYLVFEISRPIFVYFMNDFSYTFSKNLFVSDADSYSYAMQDLDSLYHISFESGTIKGNLSVDKSRMIPVSLSLQMKKGTKSGRSFSNYDNKYRINVEYLIDKYVLIIEYKTDTNGIYINRIHKDILMLDYKISRIDKKDKRELLNEMFKSVKSEIEVVKK